MTKRKFRPQVAPGVQGLAPWPEGTHQGPKFRLRKEERPEDSQFLQTVVSTENFTSMVPEQSLVDIDLITEEDEALTERLNKSADCSAALADKLLQGWTLMGEHCPRCITPLMRNKQKQLYCVSCKQWVLTEEEAASRASRQRNTHEGERAQFDNPHIARSPSNTTGPSLEGTSLEGTGNGQGEGRSAATGNEISDERHAAYFWNKQNENGKQQAAVRADAFPAPGQPVRNQPRSSLILPKVDLAMKPETVQTLTITTLTQKMEEIRGLIAVTQDVQDLRQLFQALSDCVETIKVVKSLAGEETSFVKPWGASTWKE